MVKKTTRPSHKKLSKTSPKKKGRGKTRSTSKSKTRKHRSKSYTKRKRSKGKKLRGGGDEININSDTIDDLNINNYALSKIIISHLNKALTGTDITIQFTTKNDVVNQLNTSPDTSPDTYIVRFSDTQRKLFLYFNNKNNKNIEKEINYNYTISNSTTICNKIDSVKITDFQLSIDDTNIQNSNDIINYISGYNKKIVLSATEPNSKTKKL